MSRRTLSLVLLLGLSALSLSLAGCCSRSCDPVSHFDGVVEAADGLPIHYTSHGDGKPALIFVHGWSCDLGYWDSQVAAFADDHRVVRIDLGGHGESGLDRENWSIQAFGGDVNAVLDVLKLDDVILVGHSMGGAVIVEATLASPERVRGLVGVDNFQELELKLTDEQIDGYMAQFESDFPAVVDGWVRQMFPAGVDGALVDRIAGDMAAAPPVVAMSAMTNFFPWLRDARTSFVNLPAPFLAINSDLQPTDKEALLAARPDYQLKIMVGGSHFLAQERPVEFNTLLAECIAILAAKN